MDPPPRCLLPSDGSGAPKERKENSKEAFIATFIKAIRSLT